jgi:hypothetical protein
LRGRDGYHRNNDFATSPAFGDAGGKRPTVAPLTLNSLDRVETLLVGLGAEADAGRLQRALCKLPLG